MHIPQSFREDNTPRLLEMIKDYPLATLITQSGGKSCASHLPLITEERNGQVYLLGHMARFNPQWKDFAQGPVLAVFHGPQTYITPQWYKDALNVPTWNYAVVHAQGPATLIESFEGIEKILEKSVRQFERNESKPWNYELPQDYRAQLVKAVMGFEIKVTQLNGQFKLSQNREPQDRQGVMEGLAKRSDEMSRKVLELMREDLGQ